MFWWGGVGVEILGLEGLVEFEDFVWMFEGCISFEIYLGKNGGDGIILYVFVWDFILLVLKSVLVLVLVGNDKCLVDVYIKVIVEIMKFLEKEYVLMCILNGGNIEYIKVNNLVYVSYVYIELRKYDL